MHREKRLSFFIPFHNEELTLGQTATLTLRKAQESLTDFEIILVDDRSSDRSSAIALDLVQIDSRFRYVRLKTKGGFGRAFWEGVSQAKYAHAMYLSADGDVGASELASQLEDWDGHSIQVQFCANARSRNPWRWLLSWTFTRLVGLVSGVNLPYYNGFNILAVAPLRDGVKPDFGFCTQAYALLQAIAAGADIKTHSAACRFNDAESKAITLKNFLLAAKFFYSIGFNK